MGLFNALGKLFSGNEDVKRRIATESEIAESNKLRERQAEELDWVIKGLKDDSWIERKITLERVLKAQMDEKKRMRYLRFASIDPHWLNRKTVLMALKNLNSAEAVNLIKEISEADANINLRREARRILDSKEKNSERRK